MSLKQQIEQILNDYPRTRECDISLMLTIWWKFYGVGKTVEVKRIFDLPREDHIKRYRAKLNSNGKYLPTDPKVIKKRRINIDRWRKELGYN